MRHLLVLTLLSLAAQAVAAEPVLVINKTGYWVTYPTAEGPPAWIRITKVEDWTGGTPPVSPPPGGGGGGTTPPGAVDVTAEVRGYLTGINHPIGFMAMRSIYGAVASRVEADLPWEQAPEAVKLSTDAALNLVGGAANWTAFRAKVTELAGRVKPNGKEAMVKFLRDVEAAFPAASRQSLEEREAKLAEKVPAFVEKFLDELEAKREESDPFPPTGQY